MSPPDQPNAEFWVAPLILVRFRLGLKRTIHWGRAMLKSSRLRPSFTVSACIAVCWLGTVACSPTESPSSTLPESPSLPGTGITVRAANSTWIEEQFVTEIVNLGLTQLGYEVAAIQQADYAALDLAVANGDLDYTTGFYNPGHEDFFREAGGEEKLAKMGILVTDGGIQAIMVDKTTADQYRLKMITQLQDPEIAQLFDTDGNGKANLAGCQVGWRCNEVLEQFIDVYGLSNTVEQDQGIYAALVADVLARRDAGNPVLFYVYSPHWILTRLKLGEDIVPLEVPFSLPGENEAETTVNGKNYGFLVAPQTLLANRTFVESNPVAKRWFELVTIPAEAMNAESLRIQNGESSPQDIRRHAEEWVMQNQDLFDQWLEAARKSAQ